MDLRKLTVRQRLASLRCAIEGIATVFTLQPNSWIMAVAAAVVIGAGLAFRVSALEWVLLSAAIILVVMAEMINSAIEAVTDLATSDHHPLAKQAKDAAAGAVLLTVLFSIAVAVYVFGPRLWALAT